MFLAQRASRLLLDARHERGLEVATLEVHERTVLAAAIVAAFAVAAERLVAAGPPRVVDGNWRTAQGPSGVPQEHARVFEAFDQRRSGLAIGHERDVKVFVPGASEAIAPTAVDRNLACFGP